MSAFIIAATKTIDGQSFESSQTPDDCHAMQAQLLSAGINLHHLIIDPLSTDWHSPLEAGHYRSGAAPIEALTQAISILQSPNTAVVISGNDPLRTGYEKAERLQRMEIYGRDYSLIAAYTELSKTFANKHDFSEEQFREIAKSLFDNYLQTFTTQNPEATLPNASWFNPISDLFRGVDCANPVQDFCGQLILCNAETAEKLAIPDSEKVEILGASCLTLLQDGKPAIEEIAEYRHLKTVYQRACQQSGVNFKTEFLQGNAILDVYTCFPVVPMAFLFAAEFIDSAAEFTSFLAKHPVTFNGGMNLAKGPWNNPTLSSLVDSYQALTTGRASLAGIHGNGGLGYKQGFAILSRADHHN
ncbi:hypothetical protein [Aliamphritea ceti]|uniref:hypothetical protein n=1 Tax=Aliamphritea ceti TaxID=1524258 RepID=UPI0021C40F72|nr:hypothetical protein [Aliamphritea ceti]